MRGFTKVINVVLLLWLFGCAGQAIRNGTDERELPTEAAAETATPRTGVAGTAEGVPEVAVFPQIAHSAWVYSVAFSPDRKHLASGSMDKTIKIWDTENGRELRTLTGHDDEVMSVAYNSDGKQIVSGSKDNRLKLWDAETGLELKSFSGHGEAVNSVVFSPDGKYIVSGSSDRNIKVWDTEGGGELFSLTGHTDAVNAVSYSPDGKYIVSGSSDGTIKIWDAEKGSLIRSLSEEDNGISNTGNGRRIPSSGLIITPRIDIFSVAFSPDGKNIVSGATSGIIIWDVKSGNKLIRYVTHESSVLSVAYSPDGNRLTAGLSNGDVSILDGKDCTELFRIPGNTFQAFSVAQSPDGRFIAVGFSDSSISILDGETGQKYSHLTWYNDGVYSAAFGPDGESIVSISRDNNIYMWDLGHGNLAKTLSGHTTPVISGQFSPVGNRLLSFSEDALIKVWDVKTGNQILNFPGRFPFFTPDGKRIIYTDNGVKFRDAETGEELPSGFSVFAFGLQSAILSPDGKYILCNYDKDIKLLDAVSGKRVRTAYDFPGRSTFQSSVYSPDGKQIAFGMSNNTIKLLDTETRRELRILLGHNDIVYSVAYSPDGKRIVSASRDQTVRVWDAETGDETLCIRGHLFWVFSVSFSPDGRFILSASGDGTTRLWDAFTGREIAQFIAFTDGEWIVITPDGYYNASPRGDEYLNVRIGNEVYGIDQFSAAFYHPEVVTARLQGLPDPPVVKERGSIKTASIPPTLKVLVSDENQSTRQAVLSVIATDWIRQIDTVEIIVNGRLVGGSELQPVTANGLISESTRLAVSSPEKRFEFTLPVNLDPGNNHIEIVAANDYNYGLGTLQINMPETGTEQKGDIWVLAIGINDYVENPFYEDLNYGVSDAKKIIDSFKAQEGKRFDRVHTLYVSDNGDVTPTRENILASMEFLKQAGPNDTAVLFVAAHGKTEEGVYYFLSSDTVFTGDGKFDTKTAVNIDDLTKALDIPGRKLVFLDTCESGGVDNNRLVRTLKNRSTVIFTASQQEESSLENELYRGGFFTDGITRGLNGEAAEHGVVSIDRLGDYVIKRVIGISHDRQHPVKLIPEGFRNFVITLVE